MADSHCVCCFALISLAAIIIGCEPQSETEQAQKDPLVQALSQVGRMYHNHHDVHNVGPASWEELSTMAGEDRTKLDAIQTVKDKGYDLNWDVKFRDVTEGLSNTVMGQSPQGGPKLMFDGSISL